MADQTIDEYLDAAPADVRPVLERLRRTLHDAVPGADERISYAMPTLTVDGRSLVHFAAWETHVAVYPVPAGDEDLRRELAPYVAGKGTLRFPLGEPVPYELIGRVAAALLDQR